MILIRRSVQFSSRAPLLKNLQARIEISNVLGWQVGVHGNHFFTYFKWANNYVEDCMFLFVCFFLGGGWGGVVLMHTYFHYSSGYIRFVTMFLLWDTKSNKS